MKGGGERKEGVRDCEATSCNLGVQTDAGNFSVVSLSLVKSLEREKKERESEKEREREREREREKQKYMHKHKIMKVRKREMEADRRGHTN